MVEDFDHILAGISCHKAHSDRLGDVITVNFADDFAFEVAMEEWISLQNFVVITAHAGCNAEDERGSWAYVITLLFVSSTAADVLTVCPP